MGYLPAAVLVVIGVVLLVVLVLVVRRHAGLASREADSLRRDVDTATSALREGAEARRGRRAGAS
jgi:hypothetical protein